MDSAIGTSDTSGNAINYTGIDIAPMAAMALSCPMVSIGPVGGTPPQAPLSPLPRGGMQQP